RLPCGARNAPHFFVDKLKTSPEAALAQNIVLQVLPSILIHASYLPYTFLGTRIQARFASTAGVACVFFYELQHFRFAFFCWPPRPMPSRSTKTSLRCRPRCNRCKT